MRLNQVISLSQFIADQQSKHKEATGDLSKIFRDIKFAAKIVNRDVRKAGLVDILGAFGTVNVQGEEVKKLDMLANEEFKSSLTLGGDCCAIISEEEEDIHHIETTLNVNSKYIIAMDPLDGSSNIDVNASIGTIFSVYKRISPVGGPVTMDDVLQKGINQVAAGYIIYGSSTMMVFTTGNGVNAFTLDASIGDFCLSHPDIKIPKDGTIYSINDGIYDRMEPGVQHYVDYCRNSTTKETYSARYIGSMVADFHRNMLKGGIFMYPSTTDAPNGKLRLMFESNPMAFITEQAGGKATTGHVRILEIQPTEIHQRNPVFMGSTHMVEKVEEFMKQ
ncbi:MAG TPA: class 1 fructose-bisphosphatase [Bacteroidetes bacterium]|jgi:fructose-1,6-bisphosphatase I|nr:class 1 fructose-bisphosphatase [Bacteroidota bacterium]|tara:strand:- start:3941 stop:4942 length:1002 start_codon:yes stop_codon:yes gene_type:complete